MSVSFDAWSNRQRNGGTEKRATSAAPAAQTVQRGNPSGSIPSFDEWSGIKRGGSPVSVVRYPRKQEETPAANNAETRSLEDVSIAKNSVEEQSKALDALYKKKQVAEQTYRDNLAFAGTNMQSPEWNTIRTNYYGTNAEYEKALAAYKESTGEDWKEPVSVGGRIANTIGGGNLEAASGYLNVAGTLLNAYENAKESVAEKLPEAPKIVQTLAKASPFIQSLSRGKNERTAQTAEKLMGKADELAQESSEKIATAKEGAGKVGSFLVDAGKSAAQVLGDAMLNAVAPGSSLAALGTRAAGGGMQKVRQEGGSDLQQIAYGSAVAAVEVLTEKMFNGLAGAYGKGDFDSVVDGAIEKLVNKLSKPAAQNVLRGILQVASNAGEEGIEELVSGVVDPALELIYKGKAGYDENTVSEVLYDMLIGAFTGALGGGVEVAGNAINNAQAPNSAAQSVFEVAEGSNTANSQNAAEGALNASDAKQGAPSPIVDAVTDRIMGREDSVEETQARGPMTRAEIPDALSAVTSSEVTEMENNNTASDAIITGNRGRTYTEANSPVNFTYAVVPASQLITSHDQHGNINSAYPAELQPRDRGRTASQLQIQAMASSLNPELLAESPTAQNGAPIIRDDGVVVGGNARTQAIVSAYARGSAGQYEAYIRENAARFGINPESLPENPVLVRVADAADWANLAKDLNTSTIATYSATEQAMSDASRMGDILDLLSPDDDGNINTADNRAFIQAFVNNVATEAERNSLLTAQGVLSQEGERRVSQALFALAYGDAELSQRLSELTDDSSKNVTKALLAVASDAVELQNGMQSNRYYNSEALDLVLDSVQLYLEAKESGRTVEDVVSQTQMGEQVNPYVAGVAQFFEENKRSAKQLRLWMGDLFNAVRNLGDPSQPSLFGNIDYTIGDVLEAANERYEQREGRTGASIDLSQETGGNYAQIGAARQQRSGNSSYGNAEINQQNLSGRTAGERGLAYDGLGAADAGFSTPTRGEMVPTQSRAVTENINLDEATRREYAPEAHERVSAPMSMERAGTLFYTDENGNITNLHDTVDPLLEKDAWTGAEQDAAQVALSEARRTGDLEYAAKIADAINRIGGTEVGRSLQARQKWIMTGDGVFSESSCILNDPRISDDIRNDTLQHINNFANDFDNAAGIEDYESIIRRTAVLRNTARSEDLTRTINWAMRRASATGDVNFMRNAAYSSIISLAQDQVPTSLSERAKAYRRDAMLSKVSTWMRNVSSNGTFDVLDSVARNVSVPFDMLMSRFTGIRSIASNDVVSRAKINAQLDALAKSVIEVGLDISAEGAESAYGSTGNRTFKMNGGVVERLLSRWERTLNYAMYSTDQFQKGGIESSVQQGIDRLYERGLINDESLRNAGEQEALYRTFQQESPLSNALSSVRRGLNQLSSNYIRGDLQLGDIMMPFVQVPANLVDVTIDYTPLGLAKTALETYRNAQNGALTAAQQARMSQSFGRALTGTSIIALSAFAKALGLLTVSDDGKEDDKDRSALESQSGMKGTQFNLSALVRVLQTGEGTERQAGDTVISMGYLDPENALFTIGSLLYDDLASEEGYQFGDLTKDSASGIIQSVADLPMMSTIGDMSNAYRYSKADTDGGRAVDALKQYAAGQVASFVPNFLGGIAAGTDRYQRDLYTSDSAAGRALDAVKARIPGLRQTLPVKTDSYGNKMETGNPVLNFLNNTILPGTIMQYNPPSPELTEWLNDLYDRTGETGVYPNRKPSNWSVDIDGDKKADKIRLSGEEQKEYQKVYGSVFESLVDRLMSGADDTNLTSTEIADIITNINSYANAQAKNDYYKSHDIDVEANTNSTVKKAVEAMESGVDMARYYELKKVYDEISGGNGSAYDKAAEWGHYLDTESGLTSAQVKKMEELLKYSGGFSVSVSERYENLKSSGLSADNAKAVYDNVSTLEPLTGKESVSDAQKVGAIVKTKGLNATEQLSAIKAYASDSLYDKYVSANNVGIKPSAYYGYYTKIQGYVDKYVGKLDGNKENQAKKKQEITDYINSLKLSDEQKTLLWTIAYGESTSPWKK